MTMWKLKTLMFHLIIGLVCLCGTGCQLGRVDGISLAAGSFERGLWFDHDIRQYQPHGWGVKFDIVAGHMIRPVPKFWLKDQNPWKGDEPWFIFRIPAIGPYVSVALGGHGVYIGIKTFQVQDYHRSPDRYGKWMRDKEFPSDPNDVMTYLQLSGTVRRTRWK